jgi:adenosylcobinamide-phosphate synthase
VRGGEHDALALLLGFGLDRALGDPRRGHPVGGFGTLAAALERLAWRPRRSAGAAHVALLLAGAGWIGCRAGRHRLSAALVVWCALGGRSLERAALRMAELLRAGELPAARAHAPVLVGRDPTRLDTRELCRATVESVAENTADAVVGALLWGALAGAPGAAVYRAANTLDAMIGHRGPRYERFGWAAARLDDLLTWPAARLTALLSVLLAPLAGANGGEALRVLRRDGARHPSPNAGPVEAAFAGALEVRLGGTNRYPTHTEHRPELGDGRAPDVADIATAVRLSRLVGRASLIVCVLLASARARVVCVLLAFARARTARPSRGLDDARRRCPG